MIQYKRSIEKVISCSITLLVLNLTIAVPFVVNWFGCNFNLPQTPSLASNLWQYPLTAMRSVCPGETFLGRDGSYLLRSASRPSGHTKPIEITEQSFEPTLLTNRSKFTPWTLPSGRMAQFTGGSNWGLAWPPKIVKQPTIIPITVPIIASIVAMPVQKPFQNFNLTIAGDSL